MIRTLSEEQGAKYVFDLQGIGPRVLSLFALGACLSIGGIAQSQDKDNISSVDPEIRTLDELFADGSSIVAVRIDKFESAACESKDGLKLARYTAKLVHIFKGSVPAKDSLSICGFAGLTGYQEYILVLDRASLKGTPIFMPDAIFYDFGDKHYYRMLSYQSHNYSFSGKKYNVRGLEEPNLAEKLEEIERSHGRQQH
ncbi:MAG: hypothetical protein HOQ32_03765 [Lysobacter sp.]|nr:hypothetical protein [Lysobacter sp.]